MRASVWLCAAVFVVVASFNGEAIETNTDANLSSVTSAKSKLDAFLAKTSSITNLTARLETMTGRSETPIDTHPYYRSISRGITRVEQLGTQYSASGNATSIVVYAVLIDEIARRVYVQSYGQLAVLNWDSGENDWLCITDLLSGKPSRLTARDIQLMDVYDIGSDAVDGLRTEVFLLETKPMRDQRLWVDGELGLVYKARWQNVTYRLTGVKINTELSEDLFTLNLNGREIPEISEAQVGQWWADAQIQQFTQTIVRASSGPATIFTAADVGDTNAVQTLLCANEKLISATNADGSTALHYAAMEGRMGTVKLLIASQASIDPKNRADVTPLWLAAANGKSNVVQFLISKAADVNVKSRIVGLTPLHIAALNGCKAVVDLLLANGADVNALTANGETALRLALRRERTDVADLLRRHGAK